MLCEALLAILSSLSPRQPLNVEVPAWETDSSSLHFDVVLGLFQFVKETLWLPSDLIPGRNEFGENQELRSSPWKNEPEETTNFHFGLRFSKDGIQSSINKDRGFILEQQVSVFYPSLPKRRR